MVPLRTASPPLGAGSATSPAPLLERIREVDTPFRAWAGMVLTGARDARHRAAGEALLRELRDELPAIGEDLEHGDVVAYATVADAGLTREERHRLAAALPAPHAERARRSRFFDSPLYVYLAARGLAGDLPEPGRLAAFVADVATATADRAGTDLPDLVLQLATAFELAGAFPVPDALLRAVHGRLVASPGDPHAAIALRWLLERYTSSWPPGADAAALRGSVERYVESFYSTTLPAGDLRPMLAVMQLEVVTRNEPEYQLVPRAHVRRAVRSALGRQRILASLAYLVLAAAVALAPAGWLVLRLDFAWPLPLLAAATVWLPTACWSTLATLGRRRQDGALAGALVFALAYYGFVIAAAVTGNERLAAMVGGEALWALVPAVLGTVAGVLPARSD